MCRNMGHAPQGDLLRFRIGVRTHLLVSHQNRTVVAQRVSKISCSESRQRTLVIPGSHSALGVITSVPVLCVALGSNRCVKASHNRSLHLGETVEAQVLRALHPHAARWKGKGHGLACSSQPLVSLRVPRRSVSAAVSRCRATLHFVIRRGRRPSSPSSSSSDASKRSSGDSSPADEEATPPTPKPPSLAFTPAAALSPSISRSRRSANSRFSLRILSRSNSRCRCCALARAPASLFLSLFSSSCSLASSSFLNSFAAASCRARILSARSCAALRARRCPRTCQ